MELTTATFIFAVLSVALIITLIVETIEYRRYRQAVQSIIAFGEGMQKSYNHVVGVVQTSIDQTSKVKKATVKNNSRLTILEQQQQFIAMALNTVALQAMTQQELIANGKDSEAEISGT